ncbi:DsbA family protein [Ancylobacter vacuolatus]|uniref:Protein-disulfide isomerase n=1 Tax=Ancylobacter vacuolatus TaxID=223389 RepID=A0ABU0DED0_9HYPH|nr:DsbA family protein [Ancylobacter vacuolatus]MDQ0346770.1 protein-disulfide isomerase [Ancylobacter vacuolatus]
MKRRALLLTAAGALFGACLPLLAATPDVSPPPSADKPLDVDALLHDPQTPTFGNPMGDVTIVAFFDYNCGYCRKSLPELERLVSEDGKIRLVYKDWPILAESSVVAAQLALAAGYQDKYLDAHKILMKLPGKLTTERMSEALAKAGIDRGKLAKDLKAHAGDIGALLKRNNEQAEALGLPGTPVYLVGPFKVAAALDYQGFKDVVADARARAAEK